MLSEKAYTGKDEENFDPRALTSEMAVASEWIVREERDPDQLYTVFVSPTSDGTLQTACSCSRGTRDLKCDHALNVLRRFRSNPDLRDQLLKRRQETRAKWRPQLPTFISL